MYRLIYQDGDSPQTHTFSSGEVVIGRSPECQVVLKDFGISRQHARLVVDDDGVRILDLKSKNGTSVNGTHRDGGRAPGRRPHPARQVPAHLRPSSLEGKVELDEDHALSEEAAPSSAAWATSPSCSRRRRPTQTPRRSGGEEGARRPGDREAQPHPEGAARLREGPDRGALGRRRAAADHGDRVRPRAGGPRVPDAARRGRRRPADAHGREAPRRPAATRARSRSPRRSPTA